ncbi:hypothetical protein JCM3765_005484 [Sporobolomyces pararoseus]
MNQKHSTKEKAAQDLFDIVSDLCQHSKASKSKAVVEVQQNAIKKLVKLTNELIELGYTEDSSASQAISSASKTLDDTSAPLIPSLQAARTLLTAVDSLSFTSSPSKLPVVHLDSLAEIQQYARAVKISQKPSELHADLTVEHEEEKHAFEEYPIWYKVDEMLEHFPNHQDKEKLFLTLNSSQRTPINGENGWGTVVRQITNRYGFLSDILTPWTPGRGQEKEYYIGSSEEPVLLTLDDAQDLSDSWESIRERDLLRNFNPSFISYTTFAVPWLVVKTPEFLIDQNEISEEVLEHLDDHELPEEGPLDLPPSHLRHLEITFQVDGSDSEKANDRLDTFFDAISPQLERLTLRIRVSPDHLFDSDELFFSKHLVDCLLSCRRLTHLEIGGFGFSPKVLPQLSTLPLSTLVILPMPMECDGPDLLLSLVKSPSILRSSLKSLRFPELCQQADEESEEALESICREAGIDLGVDDRQKESNFDKELFEEYPIE